MTSEPVVGMSSEAAAWVRAHVWTRQMRRTHAELPDFYTRCACQWGPCGHCGAGRHQLCRDRVVAVDETSVLAPGGAALTAVWLADRTCRWRCPCAAGHTPPVDEQPLTGDQFALFAIGA